MSREIKFRAWDVHGGDDEQGEMIDGDSLAFEEYAPLCDLLKDADEMKFMQYTGLHDINGKEIYEGDIVRMHYFYEYHSLEGAEEREDEITGMVAYGACAQYGVVTTEPMFYAICSYVHEPGEELEVIGNIYENQELLEEEDERTD